MYQGPPWVPHGNHHFCYTSLLIFNISPPGPFSKSMGIINFCYTYKLKRSFSISQEIVASEHCAKKHQFFANKNHQKTIGFTIRIAPHRPQNSPPKNQFSIIIFSRNLEHAKWKSIKIHTDFQCFHLMDLQITCLKKSSKNSSTCAAAERFIKRPQIENINISLDVCKIHLQKKCF